MFRRKVTLFVPQKQICMWKCHSINVFYCDGYFANNWESTTAHLVLYHTGYEAHVQHTVGCPRFSCRYGLGRKTPDHVLCRRLLACRHLAACCHLVACRHLPPVVAVKNKDTFKPHQRNWGHPASCQFWIIKYVYVELTGGQVTCPDSLA